MMNVKTILQEDKLKEKQLKIEYNPLKGIGSPIARKSLYFSAHNYILIPQKMAEIEVVAQIIEVGSVERFAKKAKIAAKDIEAALLMIRIEYDFEYWCASCVKIQDKLSKKMVPFIMRAPQLKLFTTIYNQLIQNIPIRIILLKARQWGGSTVVQIFMAWIQLFHKKLWHSVIVADVEEQSRNIRAMYSRMAQHHPSEVLEVKFAGFEGSTKNRKIVGRDAVIYLSSMQRPDSLRSADVMMAHLSEVGLWRTTDGKKPEDVVQSIAGTVPTEPYSIIVMESTAKGVGNFFHRQWKGAESGQNGYTPIFVAWYEIEIYRKEFASSTEKEQFAASLTDEELQNFKSGATLSALNWYRHKMHLDGYDKWRMCCEFPSNPIEAFQSTGRRAHPAHYIAKMRKYCTPPKIRGDMFASALYGKGAIDSSLTFEANANGALEVWEFPDKKTDMKYRYIVSMDIGGRTAGADWSVISVIDRFYLTSGGVEEAIATCRFHLDQDLAVWKAVQIAKFYNNALLVVEANSLNAKSTDGDHTLTILDEIKDVYYNLYCRSDPQKIEEGAPLRYGFFTSKSSKTDLVNQMNRRYREEGYIERDCRALDEADCYEIKDDGSFGAVEGEHDDIYMSRAIALKASQMERMPIYQ